MSDESDRDDDADREFAVAYDDEHTPENRARDSAVYSGDEDEDEEE